MQDTSFSTDRYTNSNSRPALRRTTGPIGGVAAGLARTFNLPATGVRMALAAGVLFSGGALVVAYLVAWMLIPVDDMLLESEKPASVPTTLLAIVAGIIAIQVVFGIITNLPLGWLALGGLAAWWYMRRN